MIPKASKSEIKGWENGELVIRLAAVPEKGEANEELIRHLAAILGIGKSKLHLVQGEKSRHKRVCIKELSLEDIQQKLPPLLEAPIRINQAFLFRVPEKELACAFLATACW